MLVSPTRPITPESSWVPCRLPKPTRHPICFFFPLPYTQVPLYINSLFFPLPHTQMQLCRSRFFFPSPYTQRNTTQRNTKQSTRKQRKKESPFLPPSRAGEKLEAGISRPLIASSSSRGIKARGRDLHVAGIGELDTNNKQHKQHKQKRGRKCYITPAFSGLPNKGNKIKTQNLRRGSP